MANRPTIEPAIATPLGKTMMPGYEILFYPLSLREDIFPPMALKSDPEMGVNSWLEDELYQQYLRDRSTVDESWKHLFEATNGYVANGAHPVAPGIAIPATPAPEPA